MEKSKILIQLDTDAQPSVFDRVVAIDSGVDQLFSYGNVKPEQVEALVHGAIFTRSPADLKNTAIFIGGSDITIGEQILGIIRGIFKNTGMSVSVMLDSNGSNTTAAAAVRAAVRHTDVASSHALILGGTGPVGQRAALILARTGAHVRIGSRQIPRAEAICQAIRSKIPGANVEAVSTASSADGPKVLEGRDLVIAAGAAGAVLLPQKIRATNQSLRVAIDLNAVPPVGIEGIEIFDKAVTRDNTVCYGAIGVGGTKMKIHRAAIAKMFESNDQILDAEEIYDIALRL
ncbi:MAG: bifunctional NADP-dependent methylenetetrahydromethanopterin dehydrogenase/methylenetetrahydrofolate dehydrogenase [Planctomycetes bacterium]|nr:bifunctional NADP-dependent methylenetetrahydromethanopterin dehydrogenase/methylenetetrahydrofolate dehydrogenase [Planctomycetota bacterium]